MEALLIQLLLPIVSALVTEAVKALKSAFSDGKIPPQAVPAISAAVGALCGTGAEQVAPDLGVTTSLGAVAGLAGTGLHQLLFSKNYERKL